MVVQFSGTGSCSFQRFLNSEGWLLHIEPSESRLGFVSMAPFDGGVRPIIDDSDENSLTSCVAAELGLDNLVGAGLWQLASC